MDEFRGLGGDKVNEAALSGHDEIGPLVRRVLAYASSCEESEITPELNVAGLGIDSVGLGGVAVVLESEMGVSVDFEELNRIWAQATVGELVGWVASLLTCNAMPLSPTGTTR
jgi:acyl carrier protein